MSIKVQKNIPLAKYTTFKIGGPAKFFCVARNIDEIKEALKFAQENKLDIFILGGGSNLLVSDNGFGGLVMRIMSQELKIAGNEIFADGGVPLAKLVSESMKNNLTGLEWAAGIPGTVGGAVANNAGAFGECVGSIVESVNILKIGNQKPDVKELNGKECEFSYRSSVFKCDKKYIILNVVLRLEKGNKEKSRKIVAENLNSRKEKHPLNLPSAGSVFKNPFIENERLDKLAEKYPELKNVAINNVIPTGWFVDRLNLKGKKIGGAMISEKHGNFIVNAGGAKAEDVVILISLIKQKVRDNFGVQLKEEIEYVGF